MPNTDVYKSERWFDENFSYKVPIDLTKNGVYTLILKFSEQYFTEPGMKIFDVKFGETKIINNLDIVAYAGSKLLPYDTFHEFEVRDKKVFYEGKEVLGAAVGKDMVKIEFIKGKYDNPKINAIILVKGGVDKTHKKNFEDFQVVL
jgi:hypothetical protein